MAGFQIFFDNGIHLVSPFSVSLTEHAELSEQNPSSKELSDSVFSVREIHVWMYDTSPFKVHIKIRQLVRIY